MSDDSEKIAVALVWLGGILLFAKSWQISDSFIAACLLTVIGGPFLLFFAAPFIIFSALLLEIIGPLLRKLLS
ncbi:hypothetical protein [Azonexus sp.]|uniref:hypothetical protein n=1 Tax=Azonexus sp. TaxID=1872668 RepID=UPI0039E56569